MREANDLGIVHGASDHRDGNSPNHDNMDSKNTTTSFHRDDFKPSIIYATFGSPTTRPTSASSITSSLAPPTLIFPPRYPPTYTTPAFLGTRSLHLQLNPMRFKLYNHTSHHKYQKQNKNLMLLTSPQPFPIVQYLGGQGLAVRSASDSR